MGERNTNSTKYIDFLERIAEDDSYDLKKLVMSIEDLMELLEATEAEEKLAAKELNAVIKNSAECSDFAMRVIVSIHFQMNTVWGMFQNARKMYNDIVRKNNQYCEEVEEMFRSRLYEYYRNNGASHSTAESMTRNEMEKRDTKKKIHDIVKDALPNEKYDGMKPFTFNERGWCEEWRESEVQYLKIGPDNFLGLNSVIQRKGQLTEDEEIAIIHAETILRRIGIIDPILQKSHALVKRKPNSDEDLPVAELKERREYVNLAKSYVESIKGVVVKKNGIVLVDENTQDMSLQSEFGRLKNIPDIKKVDMISFYDTTQHKNKSYPIILSMDGTVSIMDNTMDSTITNLKKIVSKWNNIVDIVCSDKMIVGLTTDGRVLCTEQSKNFDACRSWMDIREISASGKHIVGLKNIGTVVTCGPDSKNTSAAGAWRNIVSVSCGCVDVEIGKVERSYCYTLGLTEEGKILFAGECAPGCEKAYYEIISWNNVVQINCYSYGVEAVLANGTTKFAEYKSVDEYGIYNQIDSDEYKVLVSKNGNVVTEEGKVVGMNVSLFSSYEELLEQEQESKEIEGRLRQRIQYRNLSQCQHCGGKFKGIFKKVCRNCGKQKDY